MIGAKLRELRKNIGLSQGELAKAVKVNVKSIKNWEADLSDPCLSSFVQIVKLFRIPADELLGLAPLDAISLAPLSDSDKQKVRRALQAYMDEALRDENASEFDSHKR